VMAVESQHHGLPRVDGPPPGPPRQGPPRHRSCGCDSGGRMPEPVRRQGEGQARLPKSSRAEVIDPGGVASQMRRGRELERPIHACGNEGSRLTARSRWPTIRL
jgi:hypothetical protein